MRLLMALSLVLSFEAFAQRVKENIKQSTALSGNRSVIKTFEAENEKPAPASENEQKGRQKKK